VLSWYAGRGETYPWRRSSPDAYEVLVSEVMLQQTQAARVAPVYVAFLLRFPTLAILATASKADVVRAWGRLGYPRRAVALHAAARTVVQEHGGRVPSDIETLVSLPGVGPYTASAIASIAYGHRVAAVDTNVRRVVARFALGSEPADVRRDDVVAGAEAWVDVDDPGAWNQALMDLGREVCRPLPRCQDCPAAADCRFRALGVTPMPGERRRPPFEGSLRQTRGLIVEHLRRHRSASESSIAGILGDRAGSAAVAVNGLVRDGIVERTGRGRIRLAM
jgi:A/G-specific adenine glycosylase